MKIISKHKDYYDYLQGIYGVDPLQVYDRRTDNLVKFSPSASTDIGEPYITHSFAINNRNYHIIEYKGKLYHSIDELIKLDKMLIYRRSLEDKKAKRATDDDNGTLFDRWTLGLRWGDTKPRNKESLAKLYFDKNNCETESNKRTRTPVLVYGRYGTDSDGKDIKWSIPDLSTYGFAKWVPAPEMYRQVAEFISWMKDNPEIPNKQTNKEKIQSNGFDLKQSFRHRT
jgi:hypothetical protein